MIDLAVFLKRNHYQPDQVQDFIPSPFDIAACMYHTGLDPFTKKPVFIAKHLRDRKLQRALMQFFKPENYFEVRRALEQAGRQDLIGSGCDCLIPDRPPKAALDRRRKRANDQLREQTSGDHIRSAGERISPAAQSAVKREPRPPLTVTFMFSADQYQLLDFGAGRKLERFGPILVDRSRASCRRLRPPSARSVACADARYERDRAGRGRWQRKRELTEPWLVRHQRLTCELKLSDAGQVGLFPEQSDNWDWVEHQIAQAGWRLRVLNLFAHTGAGTLTAAAAGAEVTHVDAAAGAVAWARRNAAASHLDRAPIRWIVDDALKYVASRTEARPAIRRRDPRSAQLRPRSRWRSLEARRTTEGADGIVSRTDRRKSAIPAADVPLGISRPRATAARSRRRAGTRNSRARARSSAASCFSCRPSAVDCTAAPRCAGALYRRRPARRPTAAHRSPAPNRDDRQNDHQPAQPARQRRHQAARSPPA